MTSLPPARFAGFAIILFLATGIAFGAFQLAYDQFDADEFQHAHIAWLTANGWLVLRDFFDAHGPVYAFLNGALLWLFKPEPGIELLFACRAMSAAASAGLLALTYGIARRLALSPMVALTAVTILASLTVFRNTGLECRPDPLQNLFWLAGLWLLLGNLGKRRIGAQLVAGFLFGMAVMTNTKAGLGPFGVLLFYLFGHRIHRLLPTDIARDLLLLAGGALVAYAPFAAYYGIAGGFVELHVFNTTWLLSAIAYMADTARGWGYVKSLVLRQLPFVIAAGVGFALWIRALTQRAAPGTERAPAVLVMTTAFVSGWGWASNDYSQILLITLPLWSIVAAYGLAAVCRFLYTTDRKRGSILATILIVVAALPMLWTSVQFVPFTERAALKNQKQFTSEFMQLTDRGDAPGVLWNTCGGYMFNEFLQYYWTADATIGGVVKRHSGFDPFGQAFVDQLESMETRYIVGRDDHAFAELPTTAQRYIRKHFDYSDCLWTRRAVASTQ